MKTYDLCSPVGQKSQVEFDKKFKELRDSMDRDRIACVVSITFSAFAFIAIAAIVAIWG